jgi:hypothetical protein
MAEIEQIQWFDDRYYAISLNEEEHTQLCKIHGDQPDKPFFVSTTTVLGILLSPFLLEWYGKLGTERAKFKSRKAADMGSKIHDAVYRLLTGETVEMGGE